MAKEVQNNGKNLLTEWLKQQLGGNEKAKNDINVSGSDLAKIMKDAEKDKSGNVSPADFLDSASKFYNSDKLKDTEEDFTEAWNSVAGFDGDKSSLSDEDIKNIGTGASADAGAPNRGASSGASGGGASGNSGASAGASRRGGMPDADSGINSSISKVEPADITGSETSSELRSGRSDALSQLAEAQNQKQNNEAVNEAKEQVETDKEAYDKAVEEMSSEDEQIQAQIDDIQERKSGNDSAVSEQKSAIDGLNSDIDGKNSEISGLNSQLSSLVRPSESDYTVTDPETGESKVDSEAYSTAMEEYEAQKSELESQIASAEDELADLESQLADAESQLTELEQQGNEIDQEISELLQSEDGEKIQNSNAVQDAMKTYNDSRRNLNLTEQAQTAGLDANIMQLQENITAYDEAIKTKEQEEAQNTQNVQEDDNQNDNIQETQDTSGQQETDEENSKSGKKDDESTTDPVEISLSGQNYTLVKENGEDFDSVDDFLGSEGIDEITALDDNDDGIVTFSELESGGISLVNKDTREEAEISDVIGKDSMDTGIKTDDIDKEAYEEGKNQTLIFNSETVDTADDNGKKSEAFIDGHVSFEDAQKLASEYGIKDKKGSYINELSNSEAQKIISAGGYTENDDGTIVDSEGKEAGKKAKDEDGNTIYYFKTDEKPGKEEASGDEESVSVKTASLDINKYYNKTYDDGGYENSAQAKSELRNDILSLLGYDSSIKDEDLKDIYSDIAEENNIEADKDSDNYLDDVESAILRRVHDGNAGNDILTYSKKIDKSDKSGKIPDDKDISIDTDKYYQEYKAYGLDYENNEVTRNEIRTDILESLGYSLEETYKLDEGSIAEIYSQITENNKDNTAFQDQLKGADLETLKKENPAEYNKFIEKSMLIVSHDGKRENDTLNISIKKSGSNKTDDAQAVYTDEFESEEAKEIDARLRGETLNSKIPSAEKETVDYKNIINSAIENDNLSRADKIKLAETLKEIAGNEQKDDTNNSTPAADAFNQLKDNLFINYLNEMAEGNASAKDFIKADQRIKSLLGTDENGQIQFKNPKAKEKYAESVLKIYQNADENEIPELNSKFDAIGLIRDSYSDSDKACSKTADILSSAGKYKAGVFIEQAKEKGIETTASELENNFENTTLSEMIDGMLNHDYDSADPDLFKAALLLKAGNSYENIASELGDNTQALSVVLDLFGNNAVSEIKDIKFNIAENKEETPEEGSPAVTDDSSDRRISLNNDEIKEIADNLSSATYATKDENNRTAEVNAWAELDLSQYTPETVSAVIEQYEDEYGDFVSALSSNDKRFDGASDETINKNMEAVAESYIISGDYNKLESFVDEAFQKAENNNTKRLDALMNKACIYPSEMQSFIARYNEEHEDNTFDEQIDNINAEYENSQAPKNYNKQLETVKTTETIGLLERNRADDLSFKAESPEEQAELKSKWKSLADLKPAELLKLEEAYNSIHQDEGENAFEKKLKEMTDATDYENQLYDINSADETQVREYLSDESYTELLEGYLNDIENGSLNYKDHSPEILAALEEKYDLSHENGDFAMLLKQYYEKEANADNDSDKKIEVTSAYTDIKNKLNTAEKTLKADEAEEAQQTAETEKMQEETDAYDYPDADMRITLEEQEINTLIDSLKSGTDSDWQSVNLSQYSSETAYKIINAYEEQTGESFIERMDVRNAADTGNLNSIAEAYLTSGGDNAYEKLKEYTNIALSQADDDAYTNERLDALMNTAVLYPTEMKEFTAQFDEENEQSFKSEIESLGIEKYNSQIEQIENTETLGLKIKNQVESLKTNEDSLEWAELAELPAEDLSELEQAYNRIEGSDNAFELKLREMTGAADIQIKTAELNFINPDEIDLSTVDENLTDSAVNSLKNNEEIDWELFSSEELAVIKDRFNNDNQFNIKMNDYVKSTINSTDENKNKIQQAYSTIEAKLKDLRQTYQSAPDRKENEEFGTSIDENEKLEREFLLMDEAFADADFSEFYEIDYNYDNPDCNSDGKSALNFITGELNEVFEGREYSNTDKLKLLEHIVLNSAESENADSIKSYVHGYLHNRFSKNQADYAVQSDDLQSQTGFNKFFEEACKQTADKDGNPVFNAESAIEFAQSLQNIYGWSNEDNDDTVLGYILENSNDSQSFTDDLISIYQNASPEQIEQLNNLYRTSWLIQSNFSKEDETERIKNILTSISQTENISDADGNINIPEVETDEYLEYKYTNNISELLQAFSEGEINRNEAVHYLSKVSGTIDGIVDEFRNLDSSSQEKYLPILFNLLSTKDIDTE